MFEFIAVVKLTIQIHYKKRHRNRLQFIDCEIVCSTLEKYFYFSRASQAN